MGTCHVIKEHVLPIRPTRTEHSLDDGGQLPHDLGTGLDSKQHIVLQGLGGCFCLGQLCSQESDLRSGRLYRNQVGLYDRLASGDVSVNDDCFGLAHEEDPRAIGTTNQEKSYTSPGSNLQGMATGMIIDGVFASQAIDSSGEILDIEGCDISTLDKDGVANYEHKQPEDKSSDGKSKANNGEEIVGKIVYAHRVMKESDCENDRQKGYWQKVGKIPFIYGIVRLYDGAGHDGARALAAQIRDHNANGEQILVRFSIEGNTLDRKGNRLVESVARRVALTLKPCNRTAVSGLIEDPKAPDGFEKKPVKPTGKVKDLLATLMDDHRDQEDVEKREHQHPMYTKLGGVHEIETRPLIKDEGDLLQALKLITKAKMIKALTAGNYNAAPGSLSGGAALQREDQSLKHRALAALRDYGKKKFDKSEFRAFVKNRLPEASDDFVDHFADLAEDYHVKLKKAEDLIKKEAAKAAKPKVAKPKKAKVPKIAAPEPEAEEGGEEEAPAPQVAAGSPPMQLTIAGKPAKPTTADKVVFDEKSGILHVPAVAPSTDKNGKYNPGHSGGQFPMYIPSRDKQPGAAESFHNLMGDEKINKFHDYAMDNWARVNKLLRDGKLPPEVVMHATLFSQLSPNTPVPMQEYMYAHLVDSMRHKGVDARDPAFANLRDDWLGRDTGDLVPEQSREYFDKLGGIRLKNTSYKMVPKEGAANAGRSGKNLVRAVDEQGNPIVKRYKGQLSSFMLANNKFENMSQYHNLHDSLVDLINRHKDDARAGVSELMEHKNKAGNWEAVRQRRMEAGEPDIGPYKEGPAVAGLAPKTGRYTYGMMGGSNVMVPDTHFTRYLFGLQKGKAGQQVDNDTIQTIKDILWNERNSHVLDGIDRYYAQHHDAVKHMLNHPKYKHVFEGDPQRAIFPAFWKNWVAIAPHERARGFGSKGAFNELVDHTPYWEAIDPFVNPLHKSEDEQVEASIPMRTAMIHNHWVNEYGEGPAMMLYFRHLVPRLIAEADRRKRQASIRKMEALTIDLRKATADIRAARGEDPEIEPVSFAGNNVRHGIAECPTGKYALLHEDNSGYIGVPLEHASFWHPEHLVKLPREKEGTHYIVHSHPTVRVSDME